MTIRLYVDEDAQDRDLVRSLLARGVDVVTASDAGMIERPDEEHLDYATASGRVLFSFNVSDFYRLHTEYVARGKLVQEHLETFLAQIERETGAGLPDFVKEEFNTFLQCGILARGPLAPALR